MNTARNTATTRSKKAKGGRGHILGSEQIEPAYQGAFDGLCGVYAIINAIRLLCPELDEASTKQLFKRLLTTLHKCEADPIAAVWRGMRMRTLKRLVKEARRFMDENYGIALKARRWKREQRHTITRPKQLWRRLERELSKQHVPIIGFAGKIQHWSVIRGLTPKTLQLCDSMAMQAITRRGCKLPIRGKGFDSARYLIFASQIIFIKRLPPNTIDPKRGGNPRLQFANRGPNSHRTSLGPSLESSFKPSHRTSITGPSVGPTLGPSTIGSSITGPSLGPSMAGLSLEPSLRRSHEEAAHA